MASELVREVGGVSLATQTRYTIKRKFWSVMERVFRVHTSDGQLFMYIKHPLLKLRDEFTVYADESQQQPLLRVQSKQMIAINHVYEVTDSATGVVLGAVEKKGISSIVRDKFIIRDAAGTEIGYAQELGASLLRRFVPLLTSKHGIFAGGRQVAAIDQQFRFFSKEFAVILQPSQLDPRFVLAVALLALMAEAQREDSN